MTRSSPPSVPRPDRAFLLLGTASRLPGKFDLPVAGIPMVEREIRVLTSLGVQAEVISVRARAPSHVVVHRDRRAQGPLGGLAVALALTPDPFFLFGGDMPFLEPRSLDRMRRAFDGRSVVPRSRDGAPQVLHAIYAHVPRSTVRSLLDRGAGLRDLVTILDRQGAVQWLSGSAIDPRSYVSIDTPADYVRACRRRANPFPTPDK